MKNNNSVILPNFVFRISLFSLILYFFKIFPIKFFQSSYAQSPIIPRVAIQSYSDIIEYLYELGYDHICIGGLVGLRTESKIPKVFTLVKLLKSLSPLFKKYKFS